MAKLPRSLSLDHRFLHELIHHHKKSVLEYDVNYYLLTTSVAALSRNSLPWALGGMVIAEKNWFIFESWRDSHSSRPALSAAGCRNP